MTISIDTFNGYPLKTAADELERCCGSRKWIEAMLEARPFLSFDTLADTADRAWRRLSPADWQEAFSHHPQIGAKTGAKSGTNASVQSVIPRSGAGLADRDSGDWATEEQKGTANASEQTLKKLADGNRTYEERFGYIFLVCATGKSADEMLAILESRIGNPPETEIKIAAAEHEKITRIRLEKLFK
jgi:2-oxo-4-hydroxy-4-carboxy-5-ureidoimidazoline decarboxylase